MQTSEYTKEVLSMESNNFDGIRDRLLPTSSVRLLHAALGIATEAGEIVDVVKKQLFYGKAIDTAAACAEVGDCLWYLALACDVLGVSLSDVMDVNIAKLRKRYPNGYSHERALNRCLTEERALLDAGFAQGVDVPGDEQERYKGDGGSHGAD